ncbi:hypothetical protein PMIN06_007002 [Paraphaeosphaeria minitans]
MIEGQSICAQHGYNGMNREPTSRTGIEQDAVDEHSHLGSMTAGISLRSCTPSSYNSQMPIFERTAKVSPVPTRALAHKASPKQGKVITTEQHWTPPDHYLRPNPYISGGFGSSPCSNLSLQKFASHQSSNPETLTPSASNLHLGFDDQKPSHGVGFATSMTYGQVPTCTPQEGQSAHPKIWEATSAQPLSQWQHARDYRRKVYEPPYLDPHTDDSIAYVEINAELWVEQLIISMNNTKDTKDTATSHHRRLFSSESIDPLLIESCSREIFTALMDRCKNGFRGPPAFNKALKASHQLEPDRTATCEGRIRNVVKVLSWNKRACKDVLYEDWKIKLLVNHPLSYDKEKDSQKGSNDQRRRRQLAAQEKMEKTEEELRAYRETRLQILGDSTSDAQYNNNGFSWEKTTPHEWLLHNPDRSLRLEEFGSTTGKRPHEETGGVSAKRQCV